MQIHKIYNEYKAFLLKGLAAVFNLSVIWIVFSLKGREWSNDYYNAASVCSMISIATRGGYDLFLAYNRKNAKNVTEVNMTNIFALLLGAILFSNVFAMLIDGPGVGVVFICISLFSFISIFEGLIRANFVSDQSQLVILTYSNFFLLITALFYNIFGPWEILIFNCAMSLFALASYFYINGFYVRFTFKESLDTNAASLAHGMHGLLNQQYIVYFLTKYLQEWSLPIIFTVIRFCNLASWPLNYFTFSNVASKNKSLSKFKNENANQLKIVIATALVLIVSYMVIVGEVKYIFPSIIIFVGIIIFSIFGFGFFYKINSKRFLYLLLLQVLMVGLTFFIAEFGHLNILILVSFYSLYLILCSFSYQFLPD